jgi:hypothetical protein
VDLASEDSDLVRWHTYVLNCPEMHPVSAGDLLERVLFESVREVGVERSEAT